MDAKTGFMQRAKSTGRASKVQPASSDDAANAKPARGKQFIPLSREQLNRRLQITNLTTLQIFLSLQDIAPYGKAQSTAFELRDVVGFNRNQRHRALTELEKCGLISVKRRPGRSAQITMLHEYAKRVIS
jgi:hypothetical protein